MAFAGVEAVHDVSICRVGAWARLCRSPDVRSLGPPSVPIRGSQRASYTPRRLGASAGKRLPPHTDSCAACLPSPYHHLRWSCRATAMHSAPPSARPSPEISPLLGALGSRPPKTPTHQLVHGWPSTALRWGLLGVEPTPAKDTAARQLVQHREAQLRRPKQQDMRTARERMGTWTFRRNGPCNGRSSSPHVESCGWKPPRSCPLGGCEEASNDRPRVQPGVRV